MSNELETTHFAYIQRHYWKAVTFLVILILIGSGFWGVRRFSPALFLGKPDFIAVPNEQHASGQGDENAEKKNRRVDDIRLNINTATATQLETLPKIGPQLARKIVQYRAQSGNFTSVDALKNVSGIGEKTLEKLKPFISVDSQNK